MMSKTIIFAILAVLSTASGNSQVQNVRISSRKPQLFNVRKRHDMTSKPFIVRIRSPSSNPSGRVLPPDLPPDMVRESPIVRIKPVIRFHHSDDVIHLSPLNETDVVADQFHKDLKSMSLSTMSKLLKKTGLDKDILQVGTVTLFAPTDEAFLLGPRGLLEFLSGEEDEEKAGESGEAKQKLRNFLLQHAIRGHLYPDSIRNDLTAKSLHPSGAPMRFNVYDGGQMISVSGSQFLGSPQLTGKDRILVQPIDKVLYPVTEGTILDKTKDLFPETHSLLIKAGLIDQLSSGTFTLLAPTDEAFSALPEKARDILLRNSTLLRKVMLNHVIPGTYFSTVLTNGYKLKSLSGPITFTTRRGLILANGVPIIKPDLPVTNGVIHALNRPLIPEELVEQCKCMSKYPLTPATLRPSPPPPPHSRYPGADEKFPESGEHANGFGVRFKTLPSSYPSSPDQHGALSRPANRDRKPINSTRSEPVESEDHDSPLEQLMHTPVVLADGRKLTFNTANQLFDRTHLIDKIRHPGPRGITVLLPSDAAFSKLPPEHLQKLRRDPERLKNTLEWHVLDETLDPDTLGGNARVKTLGGHTHVVKLMPDRKRFLIGGTPVLSVKRTPRVTILAIDKVFDPPPEENTLDKNSPITTAALEQGPDNDLSIWRNIIDGLPEVRRYLKSKDRLYTMFAPTNGAFRQLSPENLQRVFANENLQKDLVWSHVMLGSYYRSAFTPGMTLPTLGGSLLKFDLVPRGFVVNDVPVTRAGVVTSNGVIYIVDRLLVFPPPTSYRSLDGSPEAEVPRRKPTLEDIALENDATTFLKWIHASGLRDDIRNQRRCTIFLPTNNAISQMSPTLRMATMGNPKVLARFVRYHVCGDSFIKSREGLERENQKIPTMLPGKDIRCNVYKNQTVVTASGCPVSKVIPIPGNTDDDGISVVIVNKTLSPPVGDLFLTASKSPMLRNFTKIIKISGIEKELRNEDPLTIFAPIKCVFAKMPPDEYLKLITDTNAAKEFVKRYVVRGCIYTSGMTGGMKLKTLAGTTLKIDLPPDGCIRVNGAKLKYGDMATTNGVLHVVSEAL